MPQDWSSPDLSARGTVVVPVWRADRPVNPGGWRLLAGMS
jgi:hypothetical protein